MSILIMRDLSYKYLYGNGVQLLGIAEVDTRSNIKLFDDVNQIYYKDTINQKDIE